MFRLAGLLVIVLSGAVLADPPAPSPDSAPASDSTDSTTAPDAATATPKRSARPKIPLRVVRVDAEREQAILFDKRHDANVTVGLGAMVNGYIVDAIEDDEVTLISPGGTQVVLAAPALPPAPSAAAEPPAAPAPELTGPTNAEPVDPYADATPSADPESRALQTRTPDIAPDTTLAVPDTRTPAFPDSATNRVPDTPSGDVPDMPPGGVPDTATNRVPDMPSGAVPDGDAKVVPDRQPDTQAVDPSTPLERTPDLGSPIADAMTAVVPAATASKTASGATTPARKSRPAHAASHANATTDASPNAAAATNAAGAANAADATNANATADASAGQAMTATLSAGDVDAALADFGALMSAVRGTFTPAGARIDALAAGSVFAKAGLRTGDVITAIDGTPVRGLDDAAELYARAATARSITVQLVRDGSPRTLRIAIRR